jgi:hypothetical protein
LSESEHRPESTLQVDPVAFGLVTSLAHPGSNVSRNRDYVTIDCGTGAKGNGPPGERNGQYHPGERTEAAIAEQRKFSALLKMFRAGRASPRPEQHGRRSEIARRPTWRKEWAIPSRRAH